MIFINNSHITIFYVNLLLTLTAHSGFSLLLRFALHCLTLYINNQDLHFHWISIVAQVCLQSHILYLNTHDLSFH